MFLLVELELSYKVKKPKGQYAYNNKNKHLYTRMLFLNTL